jgi:hypothetical protein
MKAYKSEVAEDLGMQPELVEEWTHYIDSLKHSAICLSDRDDELCWSKNVATRTLTVKLGYIAKIGENVGVERWWWWKVTWKLPCPLKVKYLHGWHWKIKS